MARVASTVPGEADLLCEGCGYILRGLPAGTGRCPECGRTAAPGAGGQRRPAAFEVAPSAWTFVRTTTSVWLRPGRFFGSLSPREGGTRGAWFGRLHRGLAAVLLAVAAAGHLVAGQEFKGWLMRAFTPAGSVPSYETFTVDLYLFRFYWADAPVLFTLMLLPLGVILYGAMVLGTWVAAGVTARLAAGRGTRLTRALVLRVLSFHAACWVPISLVLSGTVCGYIGLIVYRYLSWKPGVRGIPGWEPYVGVMGVEAVLGAAYLLTTARCALGRMRYANDAGDGRMP